MAHYKNRKPKSFTGCCRMCAMRDHRGGCRTKRNLSLGELRCATIEESLGDLHASDNGASGSDNET